MQCDDVLGERRIDKFILDTYDLRVAWGSRILFRLRERVFHYIDTVGYAADRTDGKLSESSGWPQLNS